MNETKVLTVQRDDHTDDMVEEQRREDDHEGKGRSQFKNVEYEKKVVLFHGDASGYSEGERVPLHCVGFG